MATVRHVPEEKPLLEELDEFVDKCIDAMSAEDLRQFRVDRTKIMRSIARRDSESPAS